MDIENETMTIEKVTTYVQVNGQVCVLNLDLERSKIMLNMASALSDNQQLNLIAVPADLKMTTLGELMKDG